MQKTDTVGSIVAKDIRTAHVFKKHNIDFCCGGGVTIEKACEKRAVNPEELMNQLKQETVNKEYKAPDFTKWKAGFLSDYIQNEHHTYVRENLPILRQYADKVAQVHGVTHSHLLEMQKLVIALIEELIPHLLKEENVLFPYIKQLEVDSNARASFITVQNPVRAMINEHEMAGEMLRRLSDLSGQFSPPEYACNTWMAYYHKLKEFQDDLHVHIHLENNILFPKAIALEKS